MFNRTEAIAEIQRRNQQRAEAKLPLLFFPHELAKMEVTYEQAAFEEFIKTNRLLYERIWNRKVGRNRRRSRDPDYRPHGFLIAMGFDSYVRGVLRRIYERNRSRDLAPSVPPALSLPARDPGAIGGSLPGGAVRPHHRPVSKRQD